MSSKGIFILAIIWLVLSPAWFLAKLCADAVGMGAYLTNKKKGLLESEKQCAMVLRNGMS